MNILGLHFGHDAAAAVLVDGRLSSYVLRERHRRIKHAMTLDLGTIDQALAAAGLTAADIDFVAITSTQHVELIVDQPGRLSFSLAPHSGHRGVSTLDQAFRNSTDDPARLLGGTLRVHLYEPERREGYFYKNYRHLYPEHRQLERSQVAAFGWMDVYADATLWRRERTLDEIAATDHGPLVRDDALRLGFHYPVTMTLDGRALPAYFVAHHACHAASTFYSSRYRHAAILTHDGFGIGRGYLSGMFFHGVGNRVYPVTPHHLVLCALYEGIGHWLGLGDVGSAGKLMGLAAYGRPRFYDHAYAGNWNDWQRRGLKLESWVNQCMGMARDMGYDLTPVGHRERMTEPLCIDLAASTQKLFEEGMLAAVEAMHTTFRRSGLPAENLCLSGGGALNCPANSRLFREGRFARMYVEPGCDDSGLAIGAAKYLYHNVFDHPLPREGEAPAGEGEAPAEPRSTRDLAAGLPAETVARPARVSPVESFPPASPYASPYLGMPVPPEEIDAALARARDAGVRLDISRPEDSARAAAEDIADDRVIGWFEGRSEIGPRALGHRSILADARKGANWPRVNRIKGREPWRPFAPAVLEAEAPKWFRGSPNPSPYMLFTAAVASQDLPAITHTDGSARIQTVDPSCGEFFRVVEQFFAITGVPVVLNTSFNGPGEPIVETPDHAIAFLERSELDALYLGGWRVTRANA